MNKEEFLIELEKLNIKPTPKMLNQLETYANFLLEYNEHTNLTAIKNKEDIYLKHFYDSLTLTKLTNLSNKKILDIGTGAGFPGLVLAIIIPNIQVTLLDSNTKKITFLTKCVEKLSLTNVTIVNTRAEDYTKIHREEYDYVTQRAVASLRILVELAIPALKINGSFLVMKGNIDEELKEALPTIAKLKSTIEDQISFELPKNKGHRTLLKITKNNQTPLAYPRTYDKIKKHCL